MQLNPQQKAINLSQRVLLFLAGVDGLRGLFHTFFLNWAALNIAQIDGHPDALLLLGVFGNSNFLTAGLFLLIALKAKELSGYVLGIIPLAYALGILGIRLNGVSMQSEFSGKYMMLAYLGLCTLTFLYFLYSKQPKFRTGKADQS